MKKGSILYDKELEEIHSLSSRKAKLTLLKEHQYILILYLYGRWLKEITLVKRLLKGMYRGIPFVIHLFDLSSVCYPSIQFKGYYLDERGFFLGE